MVISTEKDFSKTTGNNDKTIGNINLLEHLEHTPLNQWELSTAFLDLYHDKSQLMRLLSMSSRLFHHYLIFAAMQCNQKNWNVQLCASSIERIDVQFYCSQKIDVISACNRSRQLKHEAWDEAWDETTKDHDESKTTRKIV